MKVFYTKTYNLSGANAKKQNIIEITARSMGFEELSFFKFPDAHDSDAELNVRMDGIMAAMEEGATVIFQYPGMVSLRYDSCAVRHIKNYKNVKLIIMIQDLGNAVDPQGYPDLNGEMALFQQADLLIFPSQRMQTYLVERGLGEIPALYQEMWEYPYETINNDVKIEKQLQQISDTSVGALVNMEHAGIAELYDGNDAYWNMCIPPETGFCICAGIPVIAKRDSRLAELVEKYQIGFVADSGSAFSHIIREILPEQIREKCENEKKLQDAVKSGFFTKTLLQQAVYRVFMEKL